MSACTRVFELIKEKAEEQNLNLSIIQATELIFPTTATKGFFFFLFFFIFCQCLLRKVQVLGLYIVYCEDVSFRSFIHKTAGLAFVPKRYVHLAWQAIKGEPPTILGTEDFISYFETTWLVGNYPPSLWNVYTSKVRTNN